MSTAIKHTVTPKEAVKRFLYDVVERVEKTYPVWEKRLLTFLEDTEMDFEERRRIFEIQPVRHYYYAMVVGLEAAKIRSLFQNEIAEDLLAEINEIVDKVSDRNDQLVSDLVFEIIQKVQLIEVDDTKKPHDIAMKRIAELLQLTTTDSTKKLTKDIVFRQDMGQPIALSVCHWWNMFKNSRQLADTVPSPTQQAAKAPSQAQSFRISTAH